MTVRPGSCVAAGAGTGGEGMDSGTDSGGASVCGRTNITSPHTPPKTRQLRRVTNTTAPIRDEPAKKLLYESIRTRIGQRSRDGWSGRLTVCPSWR